MRRAPVVVVSLAVLAATAGVSHAEGTVSDVVATTSTAGVVTITGAGLATASTSLASAGGSAVIGGTTSAIPGATLEVTDATGAVNGWDVTATYAPLDASALSAVAALTAADDTAVNIGAAGIAVATGTDDAQKTANAALGVAESNIAFRSTAVPLTSPVAVATVDGDGRGVTAFNTSYKLTLPIKGVLAGTLYTGSVVYTVAPQAQ